VEKGKEGSGKGREGCVIEREAEELSSWKQGRVYAKRGTGLPCSGS
jgi:hypothetical protein